MVVVGEMREWETETGSAQRRACLKLDCRRLQYAVTVGSLSRHTLALRDRLSIAGRLLDVGGRAGDGHIRL